MARPEYADVLPLRRSMLTFLAELPLPIPADSVILRHPTHAPAAEILAGLPELRHRRAEVARILAESSLQEAGTPFRTVDDDSGRAIVLGQDAPTVDALAGIAHELGHCLYERARPGRSVRSQFASERLAHCLEERLVAAYLRERGSPEECRAWWSTSAGWTPTTCTSSGWNGRSCTKSPPPYRSLMPESTTSFRESLFILPGYQVVYARASLAGCPPMAARRLTGRMSVQCASMWSRHACRPLSSRTIRQPAGTSWAAGQTEYWPSSLTSAR